MLTGQVDGSLTGRIDWLGIAWTVLWALMISAPIVESDAYRYAAVMILGLYVWLDRPGFGFVWRDPFALICLGFGVYALIRFLWGFSTLGEKGASEWLYAFPLLFPGLGAALYYSRRYIVPALTVFVAVACAALLVSTDFAAALTGERIYPLFHHNPIHAAIGCGFILVVSCYWLWHLWDTGGLSGWRCYAASAVAAVNVVLSLFDIYGAKSKGVWLALLFAIVAVSVLSLIHRQSRHVVILIVACLVALGSGAYVVRHNILQTAGPTVAAAFSLSEDAADRETITAAMQQAIDSPATPQSMRERLQLWYNAMEIIEAYPLFGAGNHWHVLWKHTTYADVPYDLLHNGYLEIAVRHGAFGLVLLVVSLAMSFRRLLIARRLGVIDRASEMGLMVATLYFLVTLATNSNNRLALGESFFMVAAAAVFAASLATQAKRGERGPTQDGTTAAA